MMRRTDDIRASVDRDLPGLPEDVRAWYAHFLKEYYGVATPPGHIERMFQRRATLPGDKAAPPE